MKDCPDCQILQDRLGNAMLALRKIALPIAYMLHDQGSEVELNAPMAVQLAADPEYLKNIAREAVMADAGKAWAP